MMQSENKLFYSYSKGDLKNILITYDELFKKSLEYFKLKGNTFRSMKNYFITINAGIYTVFYEKPVCKMNLYKTRNSFNMEIEECIDLDELYELCKNIILFYSDIKTISVESCSHPVVIDTIEYIHNNLEKDLTLENVANEVHVSKNYLSLLFSKFVGLSFSDYINKLRVDKSKKLLENTNLSLLDIALECGFNSQSYFCSVFKKFEKTSPKKFRHNIQEDGFMPNKSQKSS